MTKYIDNGAGEPRKTDTNIIAKSGVDIEAIEQFLSQYYGNENRCIIAIYAKEKRPTKFIHINEIEQYNKNGYNIYFSVNPVKDGVRKKPTKMDIKCAMYAHVDLDPKVDDKYSPELKEKILEYAEGADCTFAIASGNGAGLFYRLDDASKDEVEAINFGLIKEFKDYGADSGTHNVDRIMRLPYTMNYPTANKLDQGYRKEPVQAYWINATNKVYDKSAFKTVEALEAFNVDIVTKESIKRSNEEIQAIIDDIKVSDNKGMSEVDFKFFLDYIEKRREDDSSFVPTEEHMRDVLKLKGMYLVREERSPDNPNKYERSDYLTRTIKSVIKKIELGFDELDSKLGKESKEGLLDKLREGIMSKDEKEKFRNMKYLAYGLIPENHHVYVYGASGAGKTTVFHTIAKEIVAQNPSKEVLFLYLDGSPDIAVKMHDDIEMEGFDARYKIVYNHSGVEVVKMLDDMVISKTNLENIVFILDTFKYVSKNVNDKTSNVKALHMIKDLCKLGATFITLGHTNKDGNRQSGTAEVEQDSDDLLRVDSAISMNDKAKSSISIGGRVRMNFIPRTYTFVAGEPSSCKLEDDFEALDEEAIKVKVEQEKESELISKVLSFIEKKKLKKDVIDFVHTVSEFGKTKSRNFIQKYVDDKWVEERGEDKKSVYLISYLDHELSQL